MSSVYLTKREWRRLALLWVIMFTALLLLAGAIWRMQVGMGGQYEVSLERQSVRRVRIPGVRGRIFDRHGVCLADNQPAYNVAIYLEELRQAGRRASTVRAAMRMIDRVSAAIGRAPEISKRQIEEHLALRRALPLVAWHNVGHAVLARLAESGGNLPAVDIMVDVERVYPHGATAGHLLGYVGKRDDMRDADQDDQEPFESYHYYLPDMTGRAGLERRFDDFLAGQAGGQLVRVDVAGFKHDEISGRPAVPGGDIMLSLSVAAQRAAEHALTGVVGAAVVLDPQNGDVLALASAPELDPNWFSPQLAQTVWAGLLADERKPLLNRALNGTYPPGSIFKPIVAMAALENGTIDAGYTVDCRGVFALGNQTFSCYHGHIHGRIGVRRALEVSCNVFFYQSGLACGIDAIHATASALGLGRRTGVEAESEAPGIMPGREWKRQARNEGWREGDTCNVSIGQGAVLVTPIQMAVAAAAIANGGFLYRPRLVLGRRRTPEGAFQTEPPMLTRKLNWSADNLALVRAGMQDAVQGEAGTGRHAQVPGVRVAGKTGTAEYGRKSERRKHGWMIAYAPAEQPRYAVAMVVDEIATAGGAEVGPRMRRLLCALFQVPEEWI